MNIDTTEGQEGLVLYSADLRLLREYSQDFKTQMMEINACDNDGLKGLICIIIY